MKGGVSAEPDWQLRPAIRLTVEQQAELIGLLNELKLQLREKDDLPEAIEQEAQSITGEIGAAIILIENGLVRSGALNDLLLKPMMHLAAHHAPKPIIDNAGALVRALLELSKNA